MRPIGNPDINPATQPPARGQLTAETEIAMKHGDYQAWINASETQYQQPDYQTQQLAHLTQLSKLPVLSILMPVYCPDPDYLDQAITSVYSQSYPHWQLCIVDDASGDTALTQKLQTLEANDSRIRYVAHNTNQHISAATNSALALAVGDFVTFLDQDDVLPTQALLRVAMEINDHPEAKLFYTDEDKLNAAGHRQTPNFKPAWNYDLLLSQNYLCHLAVYEMALLRALGGMRLGYEGAQDHDLALRAATKIDAARVVRHIPEILYHWRVHPQSTAANPDSKPYAQDSGMRAIEDHLKTQAINARVSRQGIHYRVHYHLDAPPPVTIIIPTRNMQQTLKVCIDSLLEKTQYPNFRLLIIDNDSDDFDAINYLRSLSRLPQVDVLVDNQAFNYSALNNHAVDQADTDIVCLLNNDVEVIAPGWLTEMVSHLVRDGVGIVGAKLRYPNDQIQHAGVILGIGGIAGHGHKYFQHDEPGYFGRLALVQNYSAVTGACLLTRKSIWQQVGGLETQLAVAFNDVDYCLRVQDLGFRVVWTPFADLYHHESLSRGQEDSPEKQARFTAEVDYMMHRWQHVIDHDPAYSPNLSHHKEDFSIAGQRRPLASDGTADNASNVRASAKTSR
ncbi:MAG: glycosyltransferase involved in cell wall biosynthesis [Candidatus Azotimanducaceae bacterium]|jgi:glycosyltransferase involved in cell wall biosynthesis